jgi:hypothetical protein
MAISDQLLIPTVRWYEAEQESMGLTNDDVLFLTWGISEMVIGDIPHALYSFEQLMLPLAPGKSPVWWASALLWSAICRLYLCDGAMALTHIETAEQHGMTHAMPEFELVKGMALRLAGRSQEALSVFKRLARRDGPLFPEHRSQAIAWLLEARVAAGNIATREQVRWLVRENRFHHGTVGIIAAATYRLCASLHFSECECSPDDIVAVMDSSPIFLRPMLTMILADLLPRTLAGVECGTRSLESYWS